MRGVASSYDDKMKASRALKVPEFTRCVTIAQTLPDFFNFHTNPYPIMSTSRNIHADNFITYPKTLKLRAEYQAHEMMTVVFSTYSDRRTEMLNESIYMAVFDSLENQGYNPLSVNGVYKGLPEKSILINIPEKDIYQSGDRWYSTVQYSKAGAIIELCKSLDQESILIIRDNDGILLFIDNDDNDSYISEYIGRETLTSYIPESAENYTILDDGRVLTFNK